jgi:hypothetical protein
MSSYGYDDRLVLALEQLEVARELLLSDSPAKARMAVILLDGLAMHCSTVGSRCSTA